MSNDLRKLKLELDLKQNELEKTEILLKTSTEKVKSLKSDLTYLRSHLNKVRGFINELFDTSKSTKSNTNTEILSDLDKFQLMENKLMNRLNSTKNELDALELECNKNKAVIIVLKHDIKDLRLKFDEGYNDWYKKTGMIINFD